MSLCTDKEYFKLMVSDIKQNPNSLWLEGFCQRAMWMSSYSIKNVANILIQFPNATYVAGRQQYEDIGAELYNDAVPIRIFAPAWSKPGQNASNFVAVNVYDISQTSAIRKFTNHSKTPEAHLKKLVKLAKLIGINVVSANLTTGPWKILDGNTLYIKNGIPILVASQLIAQQLAFIAIYQNHPKFKSVATPISILISYLVEIGAGFTAPNLSQSHKLALCEGAGLLVYISKARAIAKEMIHELRKL